MPKSRYDGMDVPEIAARLAQDCVVTKALARYLENVLRATYDDHVKPQADVIEEASACFEAAFADGWLDALANGDIEAIRDIWCRRIDFAQRLLVDARSVSAGLTQRESTP